LVCDFKAGVICLMGIALTSCVLTTAVLSDAELSQHVPSARSMMALHRLNNGEINESFVFFCEYFLKSVVASQTFNKGSKNGVALTNIASPSNEAFALLWLDNSEARWLSEHKKHAQGKEIFSKCECCCRLMVKYSLF
jgi:hypothetical protein